MINLLEAAQTKAEKGNYILQMELRGSAEIAIGAARKHTFIAGFYLYIGSAYGGGGMQSRINRHLDKEKKLHWNIDYLTNRANIVSVWTITPPASIEHTIAARIFKNNILTAAMERFGSADCNCATHLFYSPKKISLKKINMLLLPVASLFGGFEDYRDRINYHGL